MDKYKQMMCIKGLIMSLDEQLYRNDKFKKDGLNLDSKIIESYYKSIQDFMEVYGGITDENT